MTRVAALLIVGGLGLLAGLGGCDEPGDLPARWRYVYPAIVEGSCATAGCHSKMTAFAGVDLSTLDGAYTILVGRICGEPPRPTDSLGNYVFPFEPERSRLLYLLRGEDVPRRMPPDIALPDAEIELIEAWILRGAPCD